MSAAGRSRAASGGQDRSAEVVVEVGGWEHECCGPALERNQLVALGCLRTTGPDGRPRLTETHHHLEPEVVVRGRVVDVLVVRSDGSAEPVDRLPSGAALRGFDPADDGHLQQAWTEVEVPTGREFLVVVQVAGPGGPSGVQNSL